MVVTEFHKYKFGLDRLGLTETLRADRQNGSLPRLTRQEIKNGGTLHQKSDLVLWEHMHGRAQQGRSRQSYLSMLLKEVRTYSKKELRTLMRDRDK